VDRLVVSAARGSRPIAPPDARSGEPSARSTIYERSKRVPIYAEDAEERQEDGRKVGIGILVSLEAPGRGRGACEFSPSLGSRGFSSHPSRRGTDAIRGGNSGDRDHWRPIRAPMGTAVRIQWTFLRRNAPAHFWRRCNDVGHC
jgi:hypothetical protein